MSYPLHGNMRAFFKPVMDVAHGDTRPDCGIDIGAASGAHGDFVCMRPCTVKELLFAVTAEDVSGTTTAPTVVFTKYLKAGSATNSVAMGTLTVPSGTVIGKTVYKLVTPIDFSIGQAIHIAWTVGVGTPTGQGEAEIHAEYKPDVAGNNSSMIASA